MFSSYAVIYRRILLSWSARLLSGSSLSSVVCLLVLCFVRDRDRDRPCVSVRLLSVLHSVRDQSECVPNATMSKRVSRRYPDLQSAYTCMLFLLILPTIGGGGGVSWRFVRPTWRRWRASSVFIFELFFYVSRKIDGRMLCKKCTVLEGQTKTLRGKGNEMIQTLKYIRNNEWRKAERQHWRRLHGRQ